jgi:Lrp/AsnC family leucine-responsive transcriptional regulator
VPYARDHAALRHGTTGSWHQGAGHVLAKSGFERAAVGVSCHHAPLRQHDTPTPALDAIDWRILAALQENGRLTNVELADRVGLSPSPCLRRVRQLEAAGVIRAYRALLDPQALGLGLTVFVELKVGRHSRENADALEAALSTMPEVVACHMVSGAADFLVEVVVPDLAAYERFLSERLLVLPMVADIRSNFSLRRIKAVGPLALPC